MTSSPDPGAVIVLSTIGVDADAAALARTLVEERLAACVNVLPPMQSIYRWQGHVESAEERQLVIKTTPAQVEALKARLVALHSYDTPEFLVLDAAGSDAYLAWLRQSVD